MRILAEPKLPSLFLQVLIRFYYFYFLLFVLAQEILFFINVLVLCLTIGHMLGSGGIWDCRWEISCCLYNWKVM